MTNYLALIRKADFTDLFNFGRLHVNGDMIVDFNCEVENLPLHKELFETLTLYANSFDNAFAYLIIHYCKEGSPRSANDVYIEDVRHIYPLDRESKVNFEMTFDERIRIEDPIWSDAVLDLQKQQMFIECTKGAQNLRHICGFMPDSSECECIITDDIIKEVVNELFEDIRPQGELSPWVYLLRYERHSYYPRNTVGCFMDMVNVMCNRHAKKEVEEGDIQGTGIFQLLNSHRNTDIKFDKLYGLVYEQANNFALMAKHYVPDVDFIKVASLFFVLRNKFTDDFKYDPIFINHCKTYNKEFELALYLLGIILGHKHTYDCMYEELPLAIFKSKPKQSVVLPSKMNENQGEASEDINHVSSGTVEATEAVDQHEDTPQIVTEQPDVKAEDASKPEESPEAADQHEDTPQIVTEQPEVKAAGQSELESEVGAADAKRAEQSVKDEQEPSECSEIESENVPSTEEKHEETNSPTPRPLPKFPCKMAKLNKDGSLSKKIKINPVEVSDRQAFLDYESKGYVLYNQIF